MKDKLTLVLFAIIIISLAACTPTPAAEPTKTAHPNTATALTTATATAAAATTPTPEPTITPTVTLSATPTPETTADSIGALIAQSDFTEAIEVTKQAVESGEFAGLNEAILEVWLPVIREQTDYSYRVIESLSPRLNGLEVNEAGLAVIVDSEGKV